MTIRPSTGIATTLLLFVAAASPAKADAFGQSFNNTATVQLLPSGGGSMVLTTDPAFRRAHATAYADHSDTSGSTFNESLTANTATASASEPSVATVTNAFSNLPALTVGVDNAYSFAHRVAPSNARADGLAEFEGLFQLQGASPLPSPFSLTISVSGSASLMGDSLSDENWSANYQFYIELYDFTNPAGPVLFSASRFDMLSGPGPASVTDAITVNQLVTGLDPTHQFGVYAYFDSESSAIAPAPGTMTFCAIAGVFVARRRRH